MSQEKKLLCTACARLHNPAQFCPVHPDEPLLDPENDDVRYELINLDDRARSRTYTRWMVGLGAAGLAMGLAAAYLTAVFVNVAFGVFAREIIVGGAVGGGMAGFITAKVRYRPKFRQWTKDG